MTRDLEARILRLESQLASALLSALQNVETGARFAIEPSSEFCAILEYYVAALLRQKHAEWEKESLDGFALLRAFKNTSRSAVISGACILISDQALTPFSAEVMAKGEGIGIASIHLKLGERGAGPLRISGPVCNSTQAQCYLVELPSRLHRVHWSYQFDKP